MKTVLSIAGSDSSGGAGIQADLKTMCAHGVYGMTAITALTAQNTLGVGAVQQVPASFLGAQIDACLSDIPADAVKIGMLPEKQQVKIVAEKLRQYKQKNVVVDPVMISTSGRRLMDQEASLVMEQELFPMSTLITPNIPEAKALIGREIVSKSDMEQAARDLAEKYGCSVLIKGGHSIEDASDVLYENGSLTWFENKRINNKNTHGTGCTLSSAIASNLAMGYSLTEAVSRAKAYITAAITANLDLGRGNGPLNHMVADFIN